METERRSNNQDYDVVEQLSFSTPTQPQTAEHETGPSTDQTNNESRNIPIEEELEEEHSVISSSVLLEPSAEEKWIRRRTLTVYLITITVLYADLALMAPNLSEIADEFDFDDDERDLKLGGYIALGFFTLSFPIAILIGWLADFWNRSPLYAATVFLGEAACLATYFVQTYPQLFVTRLLTGVSISGSLPVIFSVLGDLYPASQRNAAAAIVTTGTGLGTGVGQALAGLLGPTYGWRFPFLIVSIPGMLCSLLLLCIRDPPRGRKEAARIELDEAIRNRHVEGRRRHNDGDNVVTHDLGPDCPLHDQSLHPLAKSQSLAAQDIHDRGKADLSTVSRPLEPCLTTGASMEQGSSPGNVQNNENKTVLEKKVSWRTTKEMITTPTVALVFLGAAPGALPFGFGSVFLNDYLAEDRGMTVEVRLLMMI